MLTHFGGEPTAGTLMLPNTSKKLQGFLTKIYKLDLLTDQKINHEENLPNPVLLPGYFGQYAGTAAYPNSKGTFWL
jgi:hypothetical protein